ncbi:MAG: zinc-ribbon domain-containing protein [Clostridia bacterium]
MYCRNCGAQIPDSAKFCTNCGANQNSQPNQNNQAMQSNQQNFQTQSSYSNQNLVGFSNKINDPAFSQFLKKSKKGANIFALFILIAAPVGFGIAGSVSRDFDNPQAFLMGLALGVLYYIFAVIWSKRHFSSKTWDGVVVDKDVKKVREHHGQGDSASYTTYDLYTVYFKGNGGEEHKLAARSNRRYFDYFNLGDKIRFHGGLNSVEKYDKTGDSIIYCNACGTENDINSDYCRRCKVPLLK